MPGTMTSEERERRMKEFAEANKNPTEALRRQREKEANAKEMNADTQVGLQLPWSQRRKGDAK